MKEQGFEPRYKKKKTEEQNIGGKKKGKDTKTGRQMEENKKDTWKGQKEGRKVKGVKKHKRWKERRRDMRN